MMPNLMKHLQEAGYFDQHQRVLVAVSGGLDSLTLLRTLYVSRETLGLDLGIAHVNHQQRPESAQEEAYLRQLAVELGLPIVVSYFSGAFSETRARAWRYDFFARVMAEQGYTALVTAHHRDDQVETIFHRILRGSRLRHLAGMKAVQPFAGGQLIRPFLSFSKADFPESVHFEDLSNQEMTYARNRIRLSYLPQLRQENPKFDQHLLDLATESQLLLAALTDLTKGLSVTDYQGFAKQSSAVQHFLLQDYLAGFPDLQLTKAQFDQVLRILQTKANYCQPLKAGYWLVKDYQTVQLTKINPETDEFPEHCVLNYGDTCVFSGFSCTFSEHHEKLKTYPLPRSSALLLRQPKAGDTIQLGNFHKKLSRLFIDDKLPLEARRKALVVEQAGEIELVLVADKTYLRKDPKRAIMAFGVSIEKQGDQDVRT